ncbi:hypothetical protein [Gallaecimonas sp. GXIMD4217]|uniref:hypothetical protein n=1 Tax=Gallaecimonas sp. GXIMD4217 TaxID=3131927 RepID=UPI00311AEE92
MYWLGPQQAKLVTRTRVVSLAPQASPAAVTAVQKVNVPAEPLAEQAPGTSLKDSLSSLLSPEQATDGQLVERAAVKAAMAALFAKHLDKRLKEEELEALTQALDGLASANRRMNELGTPDDNDLNHWRERQAAQTQVLMADSRFRQVAGISLSDFIALADQDAGEIHDLGR